MKARLAPRAYREVLAAVAWIAQDNPSAARGLQAALKEAATLIGRHPGAGHERSELADPPFRFMTVRGYPYLLAYNADLDPPLITRFVHMARDLPSAFDTASGLPE